MIHIVTALVENKAGVLARIVGLISGRGYNIETLNVGPTHDPTTSKMTMVFGGEEAIIEQVVHQVGKLVDVIEVVDVTRRRHLNRELILVEVDTRRHSRAEVLKLAKLFDARVIAVADGYLTMQMVGDHAGVEDFLRLLRPYAITDISRTGLIAVARGEHGAPAAPPPAAARPPAPKKARKA
jgi:acetolactate synthase-1/3 small subunit